MSNLVEVKTTRYVQFNEQVSGVSYNASNFIDSLPRTLNQLLNVVGDDIVLKGLDVTPEVVGTGIKFIINPGILIQDLTLIEISTTTEITIANANQYDASGHFVVYCQFQYLGSGQTNPFRFGISYIKSDGKEEKNNWYLNVNRTVLGFYHFVKDELNNIILVYDCATDDPFETVNIVVDNNDNYIVDNDDNLVVHQLQEGEYFDRHEHDFITIHGKDYYKNGYCLENVTLVKYICNIVSNICGFESGGSGDSSYTLPIASRFKLGGVRIGDNIQSSIDGIISIPRADYDTIGVVKIGENLTIGIDGTLSAGTGYDHPTTHSALIIDEVSPTRLFFTSDERLKLTNIDENANNYTHPNIEIGGHAAEHIIEDTIHRFVTDDQIDSWTNLPIATNDIAGVVKIGDRLSIIDGLLSADEYIIIVNNWDDLLSANRVVDPQCSLLLHSHILPDYDIFEDSSSYSNSITTSFDDSLPNREPLSSPLSVDEVVPPIGTTSIYFNGNNCISFKDELLDKSHFDLYDNDFTIECFYRRANALTYGTIISMGATGNYTNSPALRIEVNSAYQLQVRCKFGGVSYTLRWNNVLENINFIPHHIVFTRRNNYIYLFVDELLRDQQEINSTDIWPIAYDNQLPLLRANEWDNNRDITIGGHMEYWDDIDGDHLDFNTMNHQFYLNECRILNGRAIYTGISYDIPIGQFSATLDVQNIEYKNGHVAVAVYENNTYIYNSITKKWSVTNGNTYNNIISFPTNILYFDIPEGIECHDISTNIKYQFNGWAWYPLQPAYVLPVASNEILGGVKIGDRISINDSVISADIQSEYNFSLSHRDKLDNIQSFNYISTTPSVNHIINHNFDTYNFVYNLLIYDDDSDTWKNDLASFECINSNQLIVTLSIAKNIRFNMIKIF